VEKIKAYWFEPAEGILGYGDGRKPVAGEKHTVKCIPIPCEQGLHASTKALDTLGYAQSNILWIVELSGTIVTATDKCCATERTYVRRLDVEKILFECSWLSREMPAGTVISDPAWWAPRILRAAHVAAQADALAALAELVACKDLKGRAAELAKTAYAQQDYKSAWDEVFRLEKEYNHRQPLAWAEARRVIAATPQGARHEGGEREA
jgi:hypothetical protein